VPQYFWDLHTPILFDLHQQVARGLLYKGHGHKSIKSYSQSINH